MTSTTNQRKLLGQAQRLVIKVGTNVLTSDPENPANLALGRIYGLLEEVGALHRAGKQVIIVSSGSVGLGMRELGLAARPESLDLKQACAAVGQTGLMSLYSDAFKRMQIKTAQVLLSQEDLADRGRALHVRTTLTRLLELGVVPILNENDSVSVGELVTTQRGGFGDNDGLSARVACSLNADLLVLLTNVSGLYTQNPSVDDSAQVIEQIDGLKPEHFEAAAGTSSGGTGGMLSKLLAAEVASGFGVQVVIADGGRPGVLGQLIAGDRLGTWIVAPEKPARSRFIAVGADSAGALVVNDGAIEALVEQKASLLPIGVVSVEGDFVSGDVVEIKDQSNRVYGRGLVNYAAAECRKLAGRHSREIEALIGFKSYAALVTRTHLVMGDV